MTGSLRASVREYCRTGDKTAIEADNRWMLLTLATCGARLREAWTAGGERAVLALLANVHHGDKLLDREGL